jgi:zinc/manganese transport system substrate-binding protein
MIKHAPHSLAGAVRAVAARAVAVALLAGVASAGTAFARDASAPKAVDAPGPSTRSAIPVVATFSILADLVAQVGGNAVAVTSLVPPGGDVHVFRPGPNHAKSIAAAALVVANGLDFEGWMARLVRSSGYRGPVAVASAGIEPLAPAGGHAHGADDDHGRDHGQAKGGIRAVDPHAWQSVPNARRYVSNIADALCRARVEACPVFRENARRYSATLAELDREIRDTLAAVPPERRKVVTSHAAFGYFAHEYGVRFLAPVGASTDAEPSAAAVSRLIRLIRAEGVRAYFVEGVSDARLLARIRDETGGAEAGRLYADSLSAADGPAATYEAMMRFNARAIRAAL